MTDSQTGIPLAATLTLRVPTVSMLERIVGGRARGSSAPGRRAEPLLACFVIQINIIILFVQTYNSVIIQIIGGGLFTVFGVVFLCPSVHAMHP